jgi:aspartate ammonia-lyase
MEPVIVDSLIDIFEDLENAAHAMATLCISTLEWNGVRRQESLTHAVDRWIDFAAASGYEATRQAGS